MRLAPRVLRVSVVNQSSFKFGKKRVFLVGTINLLTITAEVATSKFGLKLVVQSTSLITTADITTIRE